MKKRADAKIADIDDKLRSLRKMKRALEGLASACEDGSVPTSACPILEGLEGELES